MVDKHIALRPTAHDNGPVPATARAHDDVRTADGLGADIGPQRAADDAAETVRRRGDLEVHGERVPGVLPGPAAVLVDHDPAAVGQARHGRHAGAIGVGRERDVVDDGAPGAQVARGLVHELLAVGRVALVGVVGEELAAVGEEEGLPDGGLAVVGDGAAAGGDVGDEFPGAAGVARGVQLDVGAGEVGGDGAAGGEEGACGEGADGLGKHVEGGLVAQAVVVDGVVDFGERRPGEPVVEGAVDGEVDGGRLCAVVLPGGEEGAAGEQDGASVEDTGGGVVGPGGVDQVVGYGGERAGGVGGGGGEEEREDKEGEER